MDKRFGCVVLKAQACDWQNPHVTMFFMGEVDKYRDGILDEILNALVFLQNRKFIVEPTGRGAWQVSKKTMAWPVLNDELEPHHRMIQTRLKPLGIENASKFGFNPHLSTPMNYDLPIIIDLWPFQVWWAGKVYDI